MSTFDDSFVQLDDSADSPRPLGDGYSEIAYDPFSVTQNFTESHSVKELADDVFAPQPPIYGEYLNGNGSVGSFGGSDRPILPAPLEMEPEEPVALREWRRQNALLMEEKEKREKELLDQIVDEAEQYKIEFYRKREITCENNKGANREKEKLFLENQEKFHAEVDKNYWKAIAELIPKEVPALEKKRGKKEQDKKPSIAVIQGPKPGKPTDLTRMRQIIGKLKHNTPQHLKLSPQPPANAQEVKTDNAAGAQQTQAIVPSPEAVLAA